MHVRKAGLFGLILLFSQASWALDSDAQQPVVVEADSVEIDELNHVSTYSGKVTFQQGSLLISAEKVLIETENRRIKRITAAGAPATFRQRPEGARDDVQGKALEIRYEGDARVLTLLGQAEFTQGSNLFSGSTMTYDLGRDTLRAQSDKAGKERVKVVIQPEHITGGNIR